MGKGETTGVLRGALGCPKGTKAGRVMSPCRLLEPGFCHAELDHIQLVRGEFSPFPTLHFQPLELQEPKTLEFSLLDFSS